MYTDMAENGHFQLVLVFGVLLTISLCHTNAIDVRLISRDGNKNYCVAAGRDIQSIMMWVQKPTVSYFEPNLESRGINCKFKANEDCTMYWSKNGWAAKNSLELELGPLLDRRWEGLPSQHDDRSKRHYFRIQNGTRFEIPVSIVLNSGDLFLCDGATGAPSNCYWIEILVRTTIRKCKINPIPSDNFDLYQSECKEIHISKIHDYMLYNHIWTHISVKKVGNKISVNPLNRAKLLEWEDNINVSQFTTRTQIGGQFKVHAYDLIYTTKQEVVQMGNFSVYFELEQNIFCVAIFVRMCEKCKMIVFLQDTDSGEQLGEEKTFTSNGVWEEVYFSVNISAYRKSVHKGFYIKTIAEENTSDPFWAIGETRACSSRDIRFIKYTGYVDRSCYIVRSNEPNEIMRIGSIPATKSDAVERCKDYSLRIGDKCYSSNTISIERSRICYYEERNQRSICYCSSGYDGINCNRGCESGTYGYGCETPCGYCNNRTCNNVNGHCKCEDPDAFPPTCHIVPEGLINTAITFDDDNNLIASGMQSDKISGPFEQIIIELLNREGDWIYDTSFTDDFEKLNFSKQIDRPENGWNKDIAMARFKACNKRSCSDLRVRITLPPEIPIFDGNVSIVSTENSANLKFPRLSNYENIYVLLSNPNTHSNVREQILDKLYLKCNISLPHAGWLLSTVGKLDDGVGIRLSIEPNTEYEVCIVLLNRNLEYERFSAQKIKFKSPPETTTIHYYENSEHQRISTQKIKFKSPPEITTTHYYENSEHQRISTQKIKFKSPPETTTTHYYENSEHQRISTQKIKFKSIPETTTIHYYIWPVLLLILLILAVILLIYIRKKKRNHVERKNELNTYEEIALPILQENNTYEEPIVPRAKDGNVYEVPNNPDGAQEDIDNQSMYDLVVNFLKTNIVAENAESKYLSVQDFDHKYNFLLNLLERAEPVYANFQTKYEESASLDDAISRLRICLSDVKDRLMQAKMEFEGSGSSRDNGGNQDLLKNHFQRDLREIYERIRDLNMTTNSHKQ